MLFSDFIYNIMAADFDKFHGCYPSWSICFSLFVQISELLGFASTSKTEKSQPIGFCFLRKSSEQVWQQHKKFPSCLSLKKNTHTHKEQKNQSRNVDAGSVNNQKPVSRLPENPAMLCVCYITLSSLVIPDGLTFLTVFL